MRKDIEFKTEDGVTLRGWHYLPDGRQGKSPEQINRWPIAFSAVKKRCISTALLKQTPPRNPVRLCLTIAISVRSDGEPRQRDRPWRPGA